MANSQREERILLCREDAVSAAGVRSREGSENNERPFVFLVSLEGLDAFESRGFAV